MCCRTGLAKMYLFFFNVLFFILGIASLSLGIWLTVRKSDVFRLINLVDAKFAEKANNADIDALANHGGMVTLASYVLIGLGFFSLLMGFCGCFGAINESKCLLWTYAVLASLLLLVQVAIAVKAIFFQSYIETIVVREVKNLQNKFFISMVDYHDLKHKTDANVLITFLINHIQMSLECCGIETVGDIASSPSWRASDRNYNDSRLEVPLTCCRVQRGSKGKVMRPSYDWRNLNEDLVQPGCMYTPVESNTGLNNRTCYGSLIAFVNKRAIMLITTSIVIAQYQLLGIVVACCLIRSIEIELLESERKPEQKREQKPEQKREQKPEQKPEQKREQKREWTAVQTAEQTAEQMVERSAEQDGGAVGGADGGAVVASDYGAVVRADDGAVLASDDGTVVASDY